METIYKSTNGLYYTYKNGLYYENDIMLKRNTIVLLENGNVVNSIEIEKEYTFMELKKELLCTPPAVPA